MARHAKNVVKANDQALASIARTKVERQSEWKVEGIPGLSLLVTPGGAATFYVRYTVGKGANRKWRRVALGKYASKGKGGLSLAGARSQAIALANDIEAGVDVVAAETERANSRTLRQLFEDREARDDDTAPRTLADYREALERDVFETLGDRPAADITADEFADLLRGVEDRARHACHKVRSALGSTYRWAQRHRLVKVNPIAGLGFTHQSKRRKRVLTDAELGRLWRAIDATASVTEPVRNIVRLAIMTAQRNSEVAGMEVVELKGLDTKTPRWDIPAIRMKRKSDDQYVPLTKQAVSVVQAAMPGNDGLYLFPGTTHGRREGSEWRQDHIGQETVSRAFARIAATAGLEDFRLHDIRKCVTSWLAEHGLASPEVLDAILHHGRRGVTGTHYNFALYEGQVRKALQVWAEHVEQTACGDQQTAAGNVVAMVRA